MEGDYIFTEAEYAKVVGLTKEGVRSRRRSGKLEGQYLLKDNKYVYARPRPNHVKTTPKNRTKEKRRGAHKSLSSLQYPNAAFKEHNEVKMLAKLKSNLDQETLDLIPEAVEIAKQKKQERVKETLQSVNKPKKTYSSGLYDPRHVTPIWRSLDRKKLERSFKYY